MICDYSLSCITFRVRNPRDMSPRRQIEILCYEITKFCARTLSSGIDIIIAYFFLCTYSDPVVTGGVRRFTTRFALVRRLEETDTLCVAESF